VRPGDGYDIEPSVLEECAALAAANGGAVEVCETAAEAVAGAASSALCLCLCLCLGMCLVAVSHSVCPWAVVVPCAGSDSAYA
jgi:hypothetical protein